MNVCICNLNAVHLLPGVVTNWSYDVVTSELLVTEHSTSIHCFGREGRLGGVTEDGGAATGARGAGIQNSEFTIHNSELLTRTKSCDKAKQTVWPIGSGHLTP